MGWCIPGLAGRHAATLLSHRGSHPDQRDIQLNSIQPLSVKITLRVIEYESKSPSIAQVNFQRMRLAAGRRV